LLRKKAIKNPFFFYTLFMTMIIAGIWGSIAFASEMNRRTLKRINCEAFETRSEVNNYVAKNPTSSASLDRDDDGIPCENIK